jgi:hypothetical protein
MGAFRFPTPKVARLKKMANDFDAENMCQKMQPRHGPHAKPRGVAKRIVEQKLLPIDLQHAGNDAVQLTQDIDKSCESYGYRKATRMLRLGRCDCRPFLAP